MNKFQSARAKYHELSHSLENLRQEQRPLEVGCIVTTTSGERITITKIFFGEEAVDITSFYRWNAYFPYEEEHAAMSYGDQVADVEWPA